MNLTLLLLLLLTCVAFRPVLEAGFVEWDDLPYIVENAHVTQGLTPATIAWAFTSTELANWHPLTWVSHLLDVSLFGLAPWGHHLTSLLLHLLNTALLFVALRRLTGAPWPSLAVAALFALHPLHVESVASLGVRKDVLSTTFWFAALWAWARYVEKPSASRYGLVMLLFVLGLMAKPMLMTLPLTLLILDCWPLRRVGALGLTALRPLVMEKLPLFALSLASLVITWIAQRSYAGAMTETSLAARLSTAVLGYFGYLEKTFWPAGLSVFYPYRSDPPIAEVAIKAIVLVAITAAVVRLARHRPYMAAGWAWYLVTLVPVIGFARIGQQQVADRYTYVPLVGVFVVLAWRASEIVAFARRSRIAAQALLAAGALLAVGLAMATRRQVETWSDGVTLWQRALAVGGNSTVAQNNLGVALQKSGRLDEAAAHFAEAVRLEPRHERGHRNLGNVRFAQGRLPEAIEAYEEALRLDPQDEQAQQNLATSCYNLANSLWREGKLDEAIARYEEATTWKPRDAGFHRALGLALLQQKRLDEAIATLRRSLEIDPQNASTHDVLAMALYERGDLAGARREVDACRTLGGTPTARLVAALAKR